MQFQEIFEKINGELENHRGTEKKFDRITFDPMIMGGRACIRGMRIPVSILVKQIAHGASFAEILQEYPDMEREDIQQAIEYAAWLTDCLARPKKIIKHVS